MPQGFSRRASSASTASRMNCGRPYVPASASIRATVSGGKRTGTIFMLRGGRPIRRGISEAGSCFKKTMLFSVDGLNDGVYINGIVYGGKSMNAISNQPKLSKRAQQALDLLANGGEIQHRLERNGYTGREQFETRFCATTAWSSAVKGLGFATRTELEKAGFRFRVAHRTSVSTHYALDQRHG